MNRAVIDVGTNSVKLLVARVSGSDVVPLHETSEQTRLGAGFYETLQLQPQAIQRTTAAVADFAQQARRWSPDRIRVIATSAARDATNSSVLADAIRSASGLELEIISGNQEADWVFAGVQTDPHFLDQRLLIVDVGGGSTEFILGDAGKASYRESFRIGTVRLFEKFPLDDPPLPVQLQDCQRFITELLSREVRPQVDPLLSRSQDSMPRLVGTGGTTSILAAMTLQLEKFDRAKIESVKLTLDDVRSWESHLWSLPLAERKKIRGLPATRADVILMGASIFAELMSQFGFQELRPSTRGLRFAAVI